MTTNYNRQQARIHKQTRMERFYIVSMFAIGAFLIILSLAGCGGSDSATEQDKQATNTPCTNVETDKDFVGPCDLNPPVVFVGPVGK